MDQRWHFELTAERIPQLRVQFEWALQRQQQRFVAAFAACFDRVRRIAGLTIAAGGLLGIAALAIADVRYLRASPFVFAAAGATFAFVLVMLLREKRGGPAKAMSSRRTGETIARDADRVFARIAGTPYTIDYALAGDVITARVPARGIDRAVALRRAGIVIVATDVLFVFRWRNSVTPKRLVYLSPEARTGILAFLEHARIEYECVTAAVEGFVAPIPVARIT